MFNKQNYRFLLMMFVSVSLAACQGNAIYRAYEGETLPVNRVSRIVVPESINVLYIDNHKYKGSFLTSGMTLELRSGVHQLVVEYDEFWDLSSDNHERITSQPVMLKFKLQAGKTYFLKSMKLIDVESARRFASKPVLELVEQPSGRKISVSLKYRLKDIKYIAEFNMDEDDENIQDKPVNMMRYWWQQSDYRQQQNFLNWAQSHGKKQ